jgi:hypothetical protein
MAIAVAVAVVAHGNANGNVGRHDEIYDPSRSTRPQTAK